MSAGLIASFDPATAVLLLLPAPRKSLLLVATYSRQLTNSMSAFTSGGILSEYDFRSRHSTSQLSSPNAVPLKRIRTFKP